MPAVGEMRAFMLTEPLPSADDEPVDWMLKGLANLAPPGQPEVRVLGRMIGSVFVVSIRSEQAEWAARTAFFVAGETGSGVSFERGGAVQPREVLLPTMGADFGLVAAYERVRRWHQRLPPAFATRLRRVGDHVPGRLHDLPRSAAWPRVVGRTTHPEADHTPWVGKGLERSAAFAADPAVPDGLFACAVAAYTWQEWVFALWRRGPRRFWFAGRMAPAAEGQEARLERGFDRALQRWARGDRWVAVDAELDESMGPEGDVVN